MCDLHWQAHTKASVRTTTESIKQRGSYKSNAGVAARVDTNLTRAGGPKRHHDQFAAGEYFETAAARYPWSLGIMTGPHNSAYESMTVVPICLPEL